MKDLRILLLSVIAIGFVVTSFVILPNHNTNPIETKSSPPMKGLCWVAGDSIADHNITQITDFGTNWISQTPFGWMEGHDNPEVRGNFDRAWWGETDKGIKETTRLAQKGGVKSMLKPHIWLRRSGDKWRSDIAMNSQEEWDQWFQSYKEWILHYAVVAQEGNIESLCIGTELHQTIKREHEWRHIIAEIRKVYDGELTYAANWYQEYQDVKFWDALDYIGVQAYFPLSNKSYPIKKDLKKSWSKHIKSLADLSEKYNKKVVFTEIGYKNTADAANEPWTWPQDLDSDVVISDKTQIVCYQALFESVWNEPWFNGLFIWKWFHTTYKFETYDEYFVHWDERRKERAKRRNRPVRPPVYFSPQRTECIDILSDWYTEE